MQDRLDAADAGNPEDAARRAARANRAVIVIAIAQLLGTSLWFSANGAMRDLQVAWQLSASGIGWLTNAVQAGFIVGTLLSATTGLADRVSASKVFAVCGVLGATLNALFALCSGGLASALAFRFGVGVALAGIYPLGMKLLVTWAPQRAAQTLALLVAMLTLGTASVHAIRALLSTVPWQTVVLTSSVLAVLGALLVVSLGEGPHARRSGNRRFGLSAGIGQVVRIGEFRAAALGYFGHMWELYAFWTLTPLLVQRAFATGGVLAPASTVAWWSFLIIAIGALGCLAGGRLSKSVGSARTAALALTISGTLCAIYPLTSSLGTAAQLALLLVWGISVIADSPQFSALSVKACPADKIGGALTLQNSFGFFLSACSILWSTSVYHALDVHVAWLLLPGPIVGLIAMTPLLRKRPRW
ncbi:MFS transporter [Paraburkholderia sp. Ac-20336]|uniref:MFS transporter n=1 Tax=Burkholderiaceae TaxID=119060 RepID=UPI00142129CB|nr:MULTISPECIES: MFS transporter [Burkholderiaceae]MBN3805126.1 MFS transporter [Paraburkholderia sp. Ac-20336]NIF52061.1 MFS transporter [Burkholderia sp. Ax-1724]NIF78517.1 MFS transporter [Paraburkholderia sp. Cy-641]